MSNVPARIDRATFERVMKRASELQAQRQEIGDTLSEDEVLALGREVGLSEAHLRQALVESRTHQSVSPPPGRFDRLVGSADVVVERVVPGSQESIGSALTQWFEKEELLVIQRATPAQVVWQHLDSFAGAMRKMRAAFDPRRGPSFLDRSELVTAVIVPLEEGYCHVSLIASLRKTRMGYLLGGGALLMGGMVAAGVATILGAPAAVPAVALLPSTGAGWLVTRAYRPVMERTRVGLLRALDHIERRPALTGGSPEAAPQARGGLSDIGEVVRDITREVRRAIDEGKRG